MGRALLWCCGLQGSQTPLTNGRAACDPIGQQGVVLVLRRELIQRVAAAKLHLRTSDVEKVVRIVFEEIIAAMARGDRVELRGIGAFTVRARLAGNAYPAQRLWPRSSGFGPIAL
jgi:hypothetical protein